MLVWRASAAHDTFPVKSKNLNLAPPVDVYISPDVSPFSIFDVHPVHGCLASDGAYMLTGKALESDGGTNKKAFAVKINEVTGNIMWVWGSSATGVDDAANAILQLPGTNVLGTGGDLIVAGYRVVNGVAQRSLTKLDLATGAETWTATWPGSGGAGAWEMIELTKDGQHVLLAGLTGAANSQEFNFKSCESKLCWAWFERYRPCRHAALRFAHLTHTSPPVPLLYPSCTPPVPLLRHRWQCGLRYCCRREAPCECSDERHSADSSCSHLGEAVCPVPHLKGSPWAP